MNRRVPANASDAVATDGVPEHASFAEASAAYVDQWPHSEDAVFSVAVLADGEMRFEGFSPAAERLSGLSNPDLVGRRVEDVLSPANATIVLARYQQCAREGRAISYLETLDFPTGSSDWRTTLEPVRDQTGRVVRLLGRARQIEALRTTQQDLAESEFHRALDLFPLGMALLDERGVVVFVNSAWDRFGARYGGARRAIGRKYVNVCARSTSAGLPNGAEVAEKLKGLAAEGDHFGHSYTWEDRHFVLRATRFSLAGRVRISLAHQDVTDVVSARELAALSADHLLMAQEEERARIARELHDSTSQHLVAIGLCLTNLRRAGAPSPILDDIRHSLTEAHREIRTLTYLLYPPELSSRGLVATLNGFVDGFRRRSGLSVVTSTGGPLDDLPNEVQLAILRVVQEALGNAHRHSRARRVAIDLVLKRRGLRLTVVDDGTASPGQDRPDPTGVGIRGMQARFAQFGGKLTVTFRPFGTVIDGVLPPLGAPVAPTPPPAASPGDAAPRRRRESVAPDAGASPPPG